MSHPHSIADRCLLVTCRLCATPACWAQVDFSRDIRAIFSDTCYTCHGPDAGQRVTDFRLDIKEGAFRNIEGGRTIVSGDAAESLLLQRVLSTDSELKMPPPDSGKRLSSQQIELLQQWIDEGALWESHWSFVAPQRPALPPVEDEEWCENAIDRFILATIERSAINPSPPASRETLIRRVTLDLTGLPPTPAEIDAFLSDDSPNAWPKVVDRLLQSPRYGERMAIEWLDAARYADTSGYQSDGPRDMWRWRDWVIEAFNANMPFDQFTVEQLAGDLLPNPTLQQRIATGFNRNHRGNAEGGIVPEEYQVEYVVDRVDTTSTVWLGLTMGCARCHDHKYDPVTQRDFYRLFAYFNNIPENGRALKDGNSPPYIKAPTPQMQQELDRLDQRVATAAERVRLLASERRRQQSVWQASAPNDLLKRWTIRDGLMHHFQLDGHLDDARAAQAGRTEAAPNLFIAGRDGGGLNLRGEGAVELGDVANFGYFDDFSVSLWIQPHEKTGTIVSRMTPVEQGDGYYLHLEDGRLQINLVKRWLDDSIRVVSRRRLELGQWQHLLVTYDGSRRASGIQAYWNGRPLELEVVYDGINQTFAVEQPLRLGGGQADYTGGIDEVQIYDRVLAADEAAVLASPESIEDILSIAEQRRTEAQSDKLSRYFVEQAASQEIRDADRALTSAIRERHEYHASIPTVMVMQEMETPRATHILVRGQYEASGDEVSAGTPAILPRLPQDAPNNRLGLAQWLVAPENPLTARVAVNRCWQMVFGTGIVKTAEDFGSQGDVPSHPLLLDYLATELIRSGWDLKALHRSMVLSATYRQSSHGSQKLYELDPENRLLARGSRLRLSAEMVRDQALFASGLLCEEIGGPSVFPYQPEGLWKEIASTTKYEQSHGNWRAGRAWGRGFPMGSAARTASCRPSWPWYRAAVASRSMTGFGEVVFCPRGTPESSFGRSVIPCCFCPIRPGLLGT